MRLISHRGWIYSFIKFYTLAFEETIKVEPGISLTIPKDTKFQFKNTENIPLRFIISTMPPWPGESEALPEEGPWPTSFPNNKEMQT